MNTKHLLITLCLGTLATLPLQAEGIPTDKGRSVSIDITQTTDSQGNKGASIRFNNLPPELDSAIKSVDSLQYSMNGAEFDHELDLDDHFPFQDISDTIKETTSIVAIVLSCLLGFSLMLAVTIGLVFFFRHREKQKRLQLMQQALAAGHPLPNDFFKAKQVEDLYERGIRNSLCGLAIFIFLWAFTGSLGIGCCGLIILASGISDWYIGSQRRRKQNKDAGTEQ
ncbi:MAG: DUF6249 domain-containing protein [Bacteroides sp.]|nr:DUF6249 domain-containing protein [Bacteroides sp.]